MKVQSLIFIAKCSEPQTVDSEIMVEGSGIVNLLSLRTENWWGLIVDESKFKGKLKN